MKNDLVLIIGCNASSCMPYGLPRRDIDITNVYAINKLREYMGMFEGYNRVISEKKKKKALMAKMFLDTKRMSFTHRPLLDWMILEL